MTDRTLQKLIHVGCRELGFDADTRRDIQFATTGRTSMADMTDAQLRLVVAALKAKGFDPAKSGGKGKRRAADRSDVRFAHVLWGKLARAGAVDVAGARGLNAFIRARFEAAWGSVPLDVDAMRDHVQIATVIEALKAMCLRAGVDLQK